MTTPLFPALLDPGDKPALRFGGLTLSQAQVAAAAGALARQAAGHGVVAVWATNTPATCLAVTGALLAGVPVVPVNPKAGERELGHIVADSKPALVFAEPGVDLPPALAGLPRVDVDPAAPAPAPEPFPEPGPEAPALIVYTSGTTGPPKGVVLPRRAVASNIDSLARAWQWTAQDVLVHGLPLFHVHGLILGTLGPLRLGGTLWHLGRFSTEAAAAALADGATMMFGVPTMYHRLAADVEADPALAKAFAGARLLVSGSAALPVSDHQRITAATGMRVVERYGMTETLMNCAIRADGERRPGTVGTAVDGVEVRLVDEQGVVVTVSDDETVGEVEVRGPNLFLEYLNRPDATEAAFRDGWFRTGDVATRAEDGYLRLVGRKATDLIKSGGYKIGAGEIENVLLEHPAVAEVAVTGEPDSDLGERVVAWIVPAPGTSPDPAELVDLVAAQLAPHKRPRRVVFRDSLPRNEMGKIMKRSLSGD
ncbi:malonyl-CoA/methylmalonyl-CoA synthetase [Crossiella equi]|uniref:Malonyl-CoA/methylmalonyl-CoA synthetase n=1 Tax=Crossiella equi TaxID=130796 RepID=A0ABS5A7T6_9PSEU|nr:acyl-CoA synthetase [Crossiella equi]MBP2472663.1 malonyl-CoA/methylmalonyl-CoA synthetase [Crossiella equi]